MHIDAIVDIKWGER